jgi:hypothetical protein
MLTELHTRTTDGMTVALQYDNATEELFLELLDEEGILFVPIPKDKGMQAFNHPYTFLPSRVN